MNFINLITQNVLLEIPITSVIIRLITSLVLGTLISRIFLLYNNEGNKSKDMLHSLIFLNLIICTAMMVIGNNLASAFGLVGAVSIIRFRTSVKSSRDMAFVFFTVVTGMACGLGFLAISVIAFLFIGAVMLLINKVHKKSKASNYYNPMLRVTFSGHWDIQKNIEGILNETTYGYSLYELKVSKLKVTVIYTIKVKDLSIIDGLNEKLYKIENAKDLKVSYGNFENDAD